ncbi:hypothetical protein E2320_001693 [Naja naja]|nr:hypothetical protein E2320_001693 [Naja naja]
MHTAAPLLALMLWTVGMPSKARCGRAGDTLLTEMERKAADRFRERQKSVPFRLLYSASEGNETPHDLLDTRIGRSSVGKQAGLRSFLHCTKVTFMLSLLKEAAPMGYVSTYLTIPQDLVFVFQDLSHIPSPNLQKKLNRSGLVNISMEK